MKLYMFLFLLMISTVSTYASENSIELIKLDDDTNNSSNENINLVFYKEKIIEKKVFEKTNIIDDLKKLHNNFSVQNDDDLTKTNAGCTSCCILPLSLTNTIWSVVDQTLASTGYVSAIVLGLNIMNFVICCNAASEEGHNYTRTMIHSVISFIKKNVSNQESLTKNQIKELKKCVNESIKDEDIRPSKKEILLKMIPFINFSLSSCLSFYTVFNTCPHDSNHNCNIGVISGMFSTIATITYGFTYFDDICKRSTKLKEIKTKFCNLLKLYKYNEV